MDDGKLMDRLAQAGADGDIAGFLAAMKCLPSDQPIETVHDVDDIGGHLYCCVWNRPSKSLDAEAVALIMDMLSFMYKDQERFEILKQEVLEAVNDGGLG